MFLVVVLLYSVVVVVVVVVVFGNMLKIVFFVPLSTSKMDAMLVISIIETFIQPQAAAVPYG